MAIQIDTGKPDFGDQSPIVGIDLGTTNSLVAIVRDGEPRVLESREGRRLVPSVVSLIDGKPVVGYAARAKKVRDAAHTVFSAKRLLGRGFEDLKDSADQLPYKIIPGASAQDLVRIAIGEQSYTAIEISAMILRELKSSAEQALGTKVERAVVTVPAYFNDSQRQATRAAGRLAGLDVLRIINEPTAAALAYGLDKKRQGTIAVYDLGGGTFDISILKLHDGIFEVLATHGDTALGGDDLDRVLIDVAAREILDRHGIDMRSDPQLLAALIESAEAVKIALADVVVPSEGVTLAVDVPVGGKNARYERRFTRQEFEAAARPVLERTREPCLRALADAGLKASDLTDVVMVGGPTRLKIVQDIAREIFGRTPNTSVHPDEVVAAGAAIQADILAGNNKDFLLLDVVPLSLGIETYGGLMTTIIPRNTRIPAVAREHYTTFVDNQTAVDIHVLQGEREKVEDNRSLARFKLRVQPMPAGMARVQVNFLIDADGILQVAAKDLITGNEQSIEVKPAFGLTDEQVEKMLMATMEHAEEDFVFRRLVNVRNEAETVLRSAEKNLPAARKLLPPEEALRIEQRVIALKAELAHRDPSDGGKAIQVASKSLTEASLRLHELMIKDAIASASSGSASDVGGGKKS